MYIQKFFDDKNRWWNVYYIESKKGLPKRFSIKFENWLPEEEPEYQIDLIEVELTSINGRKKTISLTVDYAMKYIESYIDIENIERI
jgi:hypothetical protein